MNEKRIISLGLNGKYLYLKTRIILNSDVYLNRSLGRQ